MIIIMMEYLVYDVECEVRIINACIPAAILHIPCDVSQPLTRFIQNMIYMNLITISDLGGGIKHF